MEGGSCRTCVGQADEDDLRALAEVRCARVQCRLECVARVQAAPGTHSPNTQGSKHKQSLSFRVYVMPIQCIRKFVMDLMPTRLKGWH